LRWILMHEAVSCAIPGAKHPQQVIDNAHAAALPPLAEEVMAQCAALYQHAIKPHVHHRW